VSKYAVVRAVAEREVPTSLPPGSVVTPEGVLLQFRAVGFGTRLISKLVDLAMQAVVLLAAGLVIQFISGALPDGVVLAIWAVVGFLIIFGYPVILESRGGRTAGQRAVGVQVLQINGSPLRFRHAAIRAMLTLVDLFVTSGFAGVVSILTTERGQRIGDLAAGTMVVRLPTRNIYNLQVSVAEVRQLPANTDLSRVTRADIDAMRMVLARGAELRDGAQSDLGRRLAQHIATRLGQPQPQGMSVEVYLNSVLVAASHRGSDVFGRIEQ
jgi:uncharacterized RDD family membrane protein YckC